jgi:hypothetical protein
MHNLGILLVRANIDQLVNLQVSQLHQLFAYPQHHRQILIRYAIVCINAQFFILEPSAIIDKIVCLCYPFLTVFCF